MPAISAEKEFLRGVASEDLHNLIRQGYTLATILQIGRERMGRSGYTPDSFFPPEFFDLIQHKQVKEAV